MTDLSRLVVVLVEPENPANIGFVARAVHCFGAGSLRLVGRSVPDEARITGHMSQDVLDNAGCCSDLSSALQDTKLAIGFSRRPIRDSGDALPLPVIENSLPDQGRIALVFGRESSGLTAEELGRCDLSVRIPDPGGLSLNLGQAVAVGLYELSRTREQTADVGFLVGQHGLAFAKGRGEPPSRSETDALVSFLMNALRRFRGKGWVEPFLRRTIARSSPDAAELRTWYGLLRDLNGRFARSSKRAEDMNSQDS